MLESFKTFKDIEHVPLRTYNQAVMCFNIREDFGPQTLEDYVSNFDETERKNIYLMMSFIKAKGAEEAQKVATKGLVLEDDEG